MVLVGCECVALVPHGSPMGPRSHQMWRWLLPAGGGVTLAVTQVSPRTIRALPSLLHPCATQRQHVQVLFLTGALPALPRLQWPGTPQMSLVLCKAEEHSFSMPEQHLPPKSTYPETRSSASSAKNTQGASKFQSNGSDIRITGDGCCSKGGAGLQTHLLC